MKICLAGEGAMGANHMKALRAIGGVEVVSVAGGIEKDVKRFAEQWSIPHWSLDLEESLARPGVAAAILATPSGLHRQHAELALARGKHVLLEIPMAMNLTDARAVVDAADRAERICMVAHTRRFAPPHAELRRRVRAQQFHLYHMVVETYFFRRENLNMFGEPRTWVDNLLWHHACHSVDLAYWLLGDSDWQVWGQQGPKHPKLGIPMDLSVCMRSKRGVLFTMAMSFNNKGPFGGFYRYIGEEDTYKVFREEMTDGEGKPVPITGAAFELQDREFVNAVRERREPESSARSCLPAMVLLDRIEHAIDAAVD